MPKPKIRKIYSNTTSATISILLLFNVSWCLSIVIGDVDECAAQNIVVVVVTVEICVCLKMLKWKWKSLLIEISVHCSLFSHLFTSLTLAASISTILTFFCMFAFVFFSAQNIMYCDCVRCFGWLVKFRWWNRSNRFERDERQNEMPKCSIHM